jgi:uncharacterized membrane protein
MFCANCGAAVAPDAPFCDKCGAAQPVGAPLAGQLPRTGPISYTPPQGITAQTGRWIGAGWQLVKADFWIWVVIALLFLVMQSVPLILQGPMYAGFHIAFMRKMLYGRVEIGDIFKGFEHFVPALIASLAILGLTFCGSLLCIIPGLIVAAIFMFTYLFIVDKRMDFWPAMQASHAIVKQDYLGFTLFFLALGLLQVAGVLACIVGLLVTIPMMHGAITVAYREIVGFEPNSVA